MTRHRPDSLRGVLSLALAPLALFGLAVARDGSPTPQAPPTAEEPGWRFAKAENPELPEGFVQGTSKRPDGSEQSFYVSAFDRPLEKKPLLIYVEGSGAQSQFVRAQGRVAYSLFGVLCQNYSDRYHVVSAEKRGIAFAESGNRGTAEKASAEYTEHATYEGRLEEILLLLDTLLDEPLIDTTQVMLLGHSEGADVVAAVAAQEPRVTHVAFLAGGGPSQFLDLIVLRRKAMREAGRSDAEIEAAVEELEEQYRDILAKRDSGEDFFAGHAYRRWSSFCLHPPADNLVKSKAKVFMAHGTNDVSVPIESFDHLVVEMLRSGREDVYWRRYPDRDHSFIEKGSSPGYDGFLEVVDEYLEWVEADMEFER